MQNDSDKENILVTSLFLQSCREIWKNIKIKLRKENLIKKAKITWEWTFWRSGWFWKDISIIILWQKILKIYNNFYKYNLPSPLSAQVTNLYNPINTDIIELCVIIEVTTTWDKGRANINLKPCFFKIIIENPK